ncbi:MAG: peptidoglycan DD-metalloendopeptidase family protein [Betaproteobacteria bacterium]
MSMTAQYPRILAQRLHASVRGVISFLSPGQWLAVTVLAFSGMAAFGVAPDSTLDLAVTEAVTRSLPHPTVTALPGADGDGYWREERVQRGDTFGRVLSRLGVDDPDALKFVRADPVARALYQLKPGKPLRVETDADGRLLALRSPAGNGELLSLVRTAEGLSASIGPAPTEVAWKMAAGEIRSSLFAAADAADLPDPVTRQLAEVFEGDIDFYHDLRRGDRFAVVYEMRYVDGEPVGAGRIIAAEFVNDGRTFRAFLWRGADGYEGYYAEDGSALRKAFLRSPMEFSRITSGFTQARFHPILQTWRAHKGIDYAAPMGTPVRATAEGKVLVAGVQNGYGNVIHIQHQGIFSTLYAHLSAFAPDIHPGSHVAQGAVIGFVGETGWATGPHLHYEFRVNNEQQNPDMVALPNGEPLTPSQKATFLAGVAPALRQLELAGSSPRGMLAAGE